MTDSVDLPRIGVLIQRPLCKHPFTFKDQERRERLGKVEWNQADLAIAERNAGRLPTECDNAVSSWCSQQPPASLLKCCPHSGSRSTLKVA